LLICFTELVLFIFKHISLDVRDYTKSLVIPCNEFVSLSVTWMFYQFMIVVISDYLLLKSSWVWNICSLSSKDFSSILLSHSLLFSLFLSSQSFISPSFFYYLFLLSILYIWTSLILNLWISWSTNSMKTLSFYLVSLTLKLKVI